MCFSLIIAQVYRRWKSCEKYFLLITLLYLMERDLLVILVYRKSQLEQYYRNSRLVLGSVNMVNVIQDCGMTWTWKNMIKSGITSFSPPIWTCHLTVIMLTSCGVVEIAQLHTGACLMTRVNWSDGRDTKCVVCGRPLLGMLVSGPYGPILLLRSPLTPRRQSSSLCAGHAPPSTVGFLYSPRPCTFHLVLLLNIETVKSRRRGGGKKMYYTFTCSGCSSPFLYTFRWPLLTDYSP